MRPDPEKTPRRAFLSKAVTLVATAAAALAGTGMKHAPARLSKAALHYQATPVDGKACTNCAQFISGPRAAAGTCRVGTGAISPHSYCVAYSQSWGKG
ncbi:MAG: iron oxidase [Betaproteobacteria bacterium]|nr:iron oxidase [Betaproteobacteria bacterium]